VGVVKRLSDAEKAEIWDALERGEAMLAPLDGWVELMHRSVSI
jgi:hypothetical protein